MSVNYTNPKDALVHSQNTIRAINVAATELLANVTTKKEFNKRIDALLVIIDDHIIK